MVGREGWGSGPTTGSLGHGYRYRREPIAKGKKTKRRQEKGLRSMYEVLRIEGGMNRFYSKCERIRLKRENRSKGKLTGAQSQT